MKLTHIQTMMTDKRLCLPVLLGSSLLHFSCAKALQGDEHLVDFESVEIGKPVEKWDGPGIRVELAHSPKKSKAAGRITFFPHLGTGHKGVVNAMANEAIPVRITFEHGASRVTARLWASTTSSASLEAFDKDGKSLGKQTIDKVPIRKTPEDHVPFFELSVEAADIATIEISGSKPGGFVAIDELRWTTNESKR